MLMTRREKEEKVYDYLCKLINDGERRGQAIEKVQKKFAILHPQTVYNIEKRVQARKGACNGK